MNNIRFIDFPMDTNWVSGEVNNGEYTFKSKLFDEGSECGIDDGRISKLTIYNDNNDCIVHYDRGWDIEPEGEEAQEVFLLITEFLENSPQRFN